MVALIPGQIAKVDQQGRLAIPQDLLRALSWWSRENQRVVGELTRKGLLRLYPSGAIRELGSASNPDAESEAAYIERAVMADKYRDLALYAAEGRLRLTKEICPWLGFSLGQKVELYAQPFPHCLEVMSMDYRFERLAEAEQLPWTIKRPT